MDTKKAKALSRRLLRQLDLKAKVSVTKINEHLTSYYNTEENKIIYLKSQIENKYALSYEHGNVDSWRLWEKSYLFNIQPEMINEKFFDVFHCNSDVATVVHEVAHVLQEREFGFEDAYEVWRYTHNDNLTQTLYHNTDFNLCVSVVLDLLTVEDFQ